MPSSTRWFDDDPTGPDDAAFLAALRAAAAGWGFADLASEATSASDEDIGRLVEVRVPGLTSPRATLRVCFEVDARGWPSLRSEWTAFGYPFDSPGLDDLESETDLYVSGVEAGPEQCGRWTAAWFERQLRRPVRRREWDRPRSGLSTLIPGSTSAPALVEWTLQQPDQPLDSRGGFRWWWLRDRPPAREVWERPGAPAEAGRG